jgi:hypothetical protein
MGIQWGNIWKNKDKIIENFLLDKNIKRCAQDVGFHISSIYRVLRQNNIPNKGKSEGVRKYKVNDHYFDIIDCSEKAYFLGFLYADGYNAGHSIILSLSKKDEEILVKLNKLINNECPIFYSRNLVAYGKNDKVYKCCDSARIRISGRNICDKLNEYGIVERKTNKIRFPVFLKENLYSHFIRGFFDGDGSISVSSPIGASNYVRFSVSLATKNEDFCDQLIFYIQKKTGLSFKKRCWDSKNFQIVLTRISDMIEFLDWIYKDSSIYLARKYERYLLLKQSKMEKHGSKRKRKDIKRSLND